MIVRTTNPPKREALSLRAYSMADHPTRTHPALDEFIARRVVAGWHPKAIVAACGHQVSLRTAYRWTKTIRDVVVVEFDGYRATFALRHDAPPTRLSAWERAA